MSTSTNARSFHSLAHGQAEAGSGDETRTCSGLACMPCPSRRKLGWSGALEGQRSGLASGGQGRLIPGGEEKGRTRELQAVSHSNKGNA